MLYEKISALPLHVESLRIERLGGIEAGSGPRKTTIFVLSGPKADGRGEDVNYAASEQDALAETTLPDLSGRDTLDGFCRALDRLDLLWHETRFPASRIYRRWALESAALDLALKQSGLSLAEALGREAKPMRFVASLGLGDEPTTEPLTDRLEQAPDLRFKIDLGEKWDAKLIDRIAELNCIETIDLKGQYRGAFTGPPADIPIYLHCAERFADALIEDPDWNEEIARAMRPFRDRIAWDAVLHSYSDLLELPFEPKWINVKPSRFGRVAELFRIYEYCECRGIRMYGGGQFELGVGRTQNQALAAIFHPHAPNDLSPVAFHSWNPGEPLSTERVEVDF